MNERAVPAASCEDVPLCRNIRVLYNFEPPTTREEIRDAALQYVRKVSGLAKPPAADVAAFEDRKSVV